MSHKVDPSGYPTDPILRSLEFKLGDLVGLWHRNRGNAIRQHELVKEYQETMRQLYELGWDSEPDLESQLPDHLMPEEYKRRNPIKIFPTRDEWIPLDKLYKKPDAKTPPP